MQNILLLFYLYEAFESSSANKPDRWLIMKSVFYLDYYLFR